MVFLIHNLKSAEFTLTLNMLNKSYLKQEFWSTHHQKSTMIYGDFFYFYHILDSLR